MDKAETDISGNEDFLINDYKNVDIVDFVSYTK
jgi:hypothetical protein